MLYMRADRQIVVDALRSRGEHDKAVQAACVLPRVVDTQRDASVLLRLDVSLDVLEDQLEQVPDG